MSARWFYVGVEVEEIRRKEDGMILTRERYGYSVSLASLAYG
jgi:hypothetical protein